MSSIAEKAPLPANNDIMLEAIRNKDREALRKLLESGANPNDYADKYGDTLLEMVTDSYVVDDAVLEMTGLLLDHGADPNKGQRGAFLPSVVYMNRSEELIRLLIDRGADITLSGGYDDHTVAHSAAKNGMIWLLKAALEQGVDPMYRTEQGHTALHYAAEAKENAIEAIDLLLAHGADLHDFNGNWGSPLFWAASRDGKGETVRHLVSLGAKIDAQTMKGERAIHLAAQYGRADSFIAFAECGADLGKLSPKGMPVMHIIAERLLPYNEEISGEALAKMIYLKEKGYPLHPAAKGSTTTGEMLAPVKSKKKLDQFASRALEAVLDLGLDPYEGDLKGFNLLHFASKINDSELLEKCLSKPGDVNSQDENGWTALHYAVCHKDGQCVQLLKESGIDPEIKTKRKYKYLKTEFPSGLTAAQVKSRL